MNKKVISSVLAGAMAVSTLGVSAFAAVPAAEALTSSSKSYAIDAGMNAPEITASIPTELKAVINPYKAIVKDTIYGDSFASGVASPTYQIVNGMTDQLAVTVTPTITAGAVAVSEKPIDQSKTTDKTVFAYLNTTTLVAGTTPLFKNTTYKADDKSQAVFKEEGEATANIMIINGSASTNKSGYFRVEGECTEKPEMAWTSKDKVKMSLVLDLAPSAGEAKDVSLTSLVTKTGGTELITAGGATTFEVAKGDITPSAIKLTLKNAYPNATTATNSDTKVFVAVNGVITNTTGATPTIATGTATYTCVAGDFPTSYAASENDEIVIILMNNNYTASYTIKVTA